MVFRFEVFGNTLLFGKLRDEQVEHFLSVAVDLNEISLQFTAYKEFIVNAPMMFFLEPFVSFSPNADRDFFFGR